MGAFSTTMRGVATDLMTSLGNPCTLTKVTKGVYSPITGQTEDTQVVIGTFSAPVKKVSQIFGQTGINTNLTGFDDNKVIIPWIGQEIDSTWLYNDNNILSVEETESQGEIIIYTIAVGEK